MDRKENPIGTMLALAMGSLFLYVLWHWKAALYLTFLFGLAGILSPYLSGKISDGWMVLGRVLGRIGNGLLLSVVFLLVVAPVGIFRRIFGKDRLRYFDRSAKTNFSVRDHLFKKDDLEQLW
jgi:hypothetical protein